MKKFSDIFNEMATMQAILDQGITITRNLEAIDQEQIAKSKIIAALVELGELANEIPAFKFWSKNKTPKTEKLAYEYAEIFSLPKHKQIKIEPQKAIEMELIDVWHFMLSIGNDYNLTIEADTGKRLIYPEPKTAVIEKDLVMQFHHVFTDLIGFDLKKSYDYYLHVMQGILELAGMLGISQERFYEVYQEKNNINHARNEGGY